MSVFRFKHFAVEQSGAAMKVGTDGVLLGAWVPLTGKEQTILDIGTGTGVIALMLAERSVAKHIVGIDIDESSARCAESNFGTSPWAERLSARCVSVQEYAASGKKFDLIVSNPPYFDDALLPPTQGRKLSRHTVTLSLEEMDQAARRLLAADGRFVLILPEDRMAEFERITSLHLHCRCEVHSTPQSGVKRVMACFGKDAVQEIDSQTLTIETDVRGEFSEEYRNLTREFYLKF